MKSRGLLFYTAIIWRSLHVSAEEATPTVKKPSPVKVVYAQEGQDITVECPLEYLALHSKFRPLMYLKQVQDLAPFIITDQDYSEYKTFSLKYGEKFLTVDITNVSKADAGQYICGVEAGSGNTFMFEIVVTESNQQLSLLLLIPALLLLLLTAGGLLALLCYKKRKPDRGEDTGCYKAEAISDENCACLTERGGDIPEVAAPSLHKTVFHTDLQSVDTSKDTWVIYENLPAPVDPIYQNLPLDTSDNNPIYSEIDSPKLYDTVC